MIQSLGRGLVVLLLVSLLGAGTVWTAESDPQADKMNPMVVTATKTAKRIENVPAVVTVITQEEIRATPARTVGDLIANMPGMYVNEPQGVGLVTPQYMTLSGIGFAGHTMVLLDGQKINTPFTDYAYLTLIPVKAVDRIEVLRGPYSALYGSSAGGGIINIITKDGGDQSYFETWGKMGDYGRYDWGIDAGFALGKYSLGLFFDRKEVENYRLYDDPDDDIDNRDLSQNRIHAKLTGTIGDHTNLALSGGFSDGTSGAGIGTKLGEYCAQEVYRPYVNAQVESLINDDLELRAQLDWTQSNHNYFGETLEEVKYVTITTPFSTITYPTFSYKKSENDSVSNRYHADVNASWTFADKQTLTCGTEVAFLTAEKEITDQNTGDLLKVQGRDGSVTDEEDTQYSLYLQWDGTFMDKFEVVLGGRFDDFESYGEEFSPKGSLRWNYIPGGNIKFSVGKGFKAPNLSQLYSVPWSISPFIVYQGNPDLEAETTWSYQASVEQRLLNNALFMRVTPYYTEAENLITSLRYSDPLNPGGLIMQPENVDEVEIKGVDVEISYEVLKGLTPFANYNYNDTRDAVTDNVMDDYPHNSAALGVRFNQPFAEKWRTSGSYAARYRGSYSSTNWGTTSVTENVGDFWFHTASIALSYREMIEVSGEFFNIFDERSATGIDEYPMGFNYLFGLSYRYNF